jgi:iron complex transport system substrate-binding protein
VKNARIRGLIIVLAAAFAMLAAACGGSSKSTSASPTPNGRTAPAVSAAPAYPLTVKRSDGKTLTVAAQPNRIVSLSPGATEIIYAIGSEGALAAVDKNANYPASANAFPTKVDAYEPNVEAITALNPDLVIVASDTSGLVPKLDSLHIPVLYVDIDRDVRTIDAVLAQIKVLGQITGNDAKASTLASSLAARIDTVKMALLSLPASPEISVYHELDSTYYSASDDTFVGDLYRTLKATNIAGNGATAYPQLTQEAIIAANPQVIILADEAFGTSIDSVKARPGWNAIDAVKNGKIFAINADIISRPGPRLVDALEQLAKDIYPDRIK